MSHLLRHAAVAADPLCRFRYLIEQFHEIVRALGRQLCLFHLCLHRSHLFGLFLSPLLLGLPLLGLCAILSANARRDHGAVDQLAPIGKSLLLKALPCKLVLARLVLLARFAHNRLKLGAHDNTLCHRDGAAATKAEPSLSSAVH